MDNVALKIEREGLVRRTSGLELELIGPSALSRSAQTLREGAGRNLYTELVRNDPIETLIITTKAPSTLPAIQSLLPRLSSKSTIVICQNGLGVLEGLLDRYWPDDVASSGEALYGSGGGRPSFVCALTSHGVWRKGMDHFVHAGMGDVKFGVVPNRAVRDSLSATIDPTWGEHYNNPLLNPRSILTPNLSHLPRTESTLSLHTTLSNLLSTQLNTRWLPLPTLQINQLQKLSVNASVNALTAIIGVHNGALVGSRAARSIVEGICGECALVFSAHLAREAGTWEAPTLDEEGNLVPGTGRLPPNLGRDHPLSKENLTENTLSILFNTSLNLSSTLQDLLAIPRQSVISSVSPTAPTSTEVDFINGYISALGRRYGIPTPLVEGLGAMVRLKEEMLRTGALDRVIEATRFRDAPKALQLRDSITPSPSTPYKDPRAGRSPYDRPLGPKEQVEYRKRLEDHKLRGSTRARKWLGKQLMAEEARNRREAEKREMRTADQES